MIQILLLLTFHFIKLIRFQNLNWVCGEIDHYIDLLNKLADISVQQREDASSL